MANAAWPASLLPLRTDGQPEYSPLVDNVIETQMETGAPKRRRRFTFVPESVSLSAVFDSEQVGVLKTFIENTLQDVLPFDHRDLRSGAPMTYVFTKRPTYTRIADNLWRVAMEWQTK